ncbi:hypothetical protein D7147_31740 [Micromonospora musae]|uniref:Uncharacterized protein n=1 Tax=Micromonospora musae TaxID=1894970 RepID=A0ABX9QUF8_9ACTN|nr:hypothetical protein D7147_31740 [Micromonospora musae]
MLWVQRRWSARDAAQQERIAAYQDLLARTMTLALRADTVRQTMRFRSGLAEGLSITLRQRRPLDSFELHDWLSEDWRPVSDAWSQVHVVGSQQAIDVADRLLDACGDLLAAATAFDQSRNSFMRVVRGEAPSDEQAEPYQAALRRMAGERVALARLARDEAGNEKVVFAFDRAMAEAEAEAVPS